MSQIKPTLTAVALTTLLFALSGCGDANKNAVFTPDTGHPANWQTAHKTAGKANLESCFECHGEELNGGIAKVSCTSCHLGSAESIHPNQWGSYAYARHSSYVEANSTTSCANAACHGAELTGVIGSGPSCTKCHLGGSSAKHPAVWTAYSSHGNYASANGQIGCANAACHGTDLKGVFLSGTSCYSCHTADSNGKFVKHPTTWNSVVADHKSTTSTTTCSTAACHGANLNGGTLSGAPSCYNCHINYAENGGDISKHPKTVTSWRTAHSGYVSAHKPISSPNCTNGSCHLAGTRTADAYCKNCHNGQ